MIRERHSIMNKNIVNGLLLTAIGVFVAVYSWANYAIGDPANMGPGFFPFYLGIMLAILGAANVLTAVKAATENVAVNGQGLLIVVGSIVVFGLTVNTVGVLLASAIAVFLSTYASQEYKNLLNRVAVAAVVAAINGIVFVAVLSMHIPLLPTFIN